MVLLPGAAELVGVALESVVPARKDLVAQTGLSRDPATALVHDDRVVVHPQVLQQPLAEAPEASVLLNGENAIVVIVQDVTVDLDIV